MDKRRSGKWTMLSIIILGMIILSIIVVSDKLKKETETGQSTYTINRKLMIGFSTGDLVIERWQKDIDILKTRAEELGYEVEVVNSYEDSTKQIEQIRTLIKEEAVAIFIIALDKGALVDVVEEAKKQGIIVIAYDRLIENANVDAYISFDNIAVGHNMAEALVEQVPKGNYVIINGSPLDHNSQMFNEGYYIALEEAIEKNEIHIIEEVWADNWREDIAYDTISRLLESGEQIDAIIGANDRLAEGAISVLSEYGLVGEVAVVGHDADISACQRIVEGKQLMTVYKPIKILAEGAIELVDQMLEDKEIVIEDTINDGKYDVPYIKFGVISVNADNMEATVIKDFFHSEEDIYRNIQE